MLNEFWCYLNVYELQDQNTIISSFTFLDALSDLLNARLKHNCPYVLFLGFWRNEELS